MCMRLVSIESNEKNQDLYEAIDAGKFIVRFFCLLNGALIL